MLALRLAARLCLATAAILPTALVAQGIRVPTIPTVQQPPPIDLGKAKQAPMSLSLACSTLARRCLPDEDANACGYYLKSCAAMTGSNGSPLLLKVSACSVIESKCRAGDAAGCSNLIQVCQ